MWTQRAIGKFEGATIVVTGASSGIGKAFVEAMAPSGAQFVLVARREAELQRLAATVERAGAQAHVQAVDLRDADAAVAAAHEVVDLFGAPDLVVANAGHSIARGVLQAADRPDTFTRSIGVNFTGAVVHLLPLIEAMAESGGGNVVGVTSTTARLPVPSWTPYQSSKAAFDAWLRGARAERASQGIDVSIVAFPLVATPMMVPMYGSKPFGAMSPGRAASWIARAAVTGQPRVAPLWMKPVEVLTAIAPTLSAKVISLYTRHQVAR